MKYIVGFLCLIVTLNLQANLLISPTRVNFDKKDRVQEVILINTTDKERTYRIEWTEKKAKEEGGYEDLSENDDSVSRLSPFIRFSPRQVRLAPGERQTIKLQLRRKADMLEPEYRSHLKFVAMPADDELPSNDDSQDGIRMALNMLVSYSIPVIYHPAEPQTAVSINSFSIEPRNDGGINLNLLLSRKMPNSAFGRIEVYTNVDGKPSQIGLANNISVFRELSQVKKTVLIPKYSEFSEAKSITIKYIGEKEFSGQTLAERTFTL